MVLDHSTQQSYREDRQNRYGVLVGVGRFFGCTHDGCGFVLELRSVLLSVFAFPTMG